MHAGRSFHLPVPARRVRPMRDTRAMNERSPLPTFREPGWAGTRDTLHLTGQMLGKLRTALAPPQPQWFHAPLDLGPTGLTTRALPVAGGSLEVQLDVVASEIRFVTNDGRVRGMPLIPARSVAAVWAEFLATLGEIGVEVRPSDKPQERGVGPRFRDDEMVRDYSPALAQGWLRVMAEARNAFEAFRSRFFGRSIVGFWWGGFDLTVLLQTGRRIPPRPGADMVQRLDLDAEHLTVGFWPGDDTRDPTYFGYVIPEPPGCPAYPVPVDGAAWSTSMGEWVLPWEAVRTAPDRQARVATFLELVWDAAGELGGWDLPSLTYERARA
jgi:hypothetical protein